MSLSNSYHFMLAANILPDGPNRTNPIQTLYTNAKRLRTHNYNKIWIEVKNCDCVSLKQFSSKCCAQFLLYYFSSNASIYIIAWIFYCRRQFVLHMFFMLPRCWLCKGQTRTKHMILCCWLFRSQLFANGWLAWMESGSLLDEYAPLRLLFRPKCASLQDELFCKRIFYIFFFGEVMKHHAIDYSAYSARSEFNEPLGAHKR